MPTGLGLHPYNPKVQCKARSKATGERCRRAALNGAELCIMHGVNGGVRRKAKEALEKAVPGAIQHLINAMNRGAEIGDLGSVIRAAVAILDRCGYGPKSQIELSRVDELPDGAHGQEFRMEDFSVETRRMMLRDMEIAAERRRELQAASEDLGEDADADGGTTIDVEYDEVNE